MLALLLAAILAVVYAFTREPWWDEGIYADVARQFARTGRLRSSLLGSVGSLGTGDFPGVDQRTYWTMPLHPVVVGLWFRVVGDGMVQTRLLSLAFAAVLVASWGAIVRRLTGSPAVAWIAAAFIAFNKYVLWSVTLGRPEALASGLTVLGAALYLRWREAHLLRAVCVAAALLAAGALAHPLAAVEGVALGTVAVVLDWRRLRPRHLLAAAAVGGAVVSPWLLYIAQDPAMFRAQWTANTRAFGGRSRVAGLSNPLGALASDFVPRYVDQARWGASGSEHVVTVQFVTVFACLAIGVLSPAVRRQQGFRLLALVAAGSWVALAVLDGSRYRQYSLHVYPALVAFGALVVYELASVGRASRVLAGALAVGFTLPGLLWAGSLAWHNVYRRDYLPVVAIVRQQQRAGASVIAGSEFAFELGYDWRRTVDDMEMRRPPDVYVQNDIYEGFTRKHPVRARLKQDYQVVYANPLYHVYVRRSATAADTSRGVIPGPGVRRGQL